MATTAVYPSRAAQALGFLKSHRNDIAIFVEDTASPNMWLKILKKYLPQGVRLNSVTPLGGRKAVLKACKADQSSTSSRRLYIIDADMDLITGRAKPKLKHLYRLRRYCVENYLLDQNALVEAITILDPSISPQDVSAVIDLEDWCSRNEDLLRQLFISYAVAHELAAGIQTVSYSCYKLFMDDGSYNFCPHKTRSRIFSVYRTAIKKSNINEVRELKEKLSSQAQGVPVSTISSAKCYILPAIFERSKRGTTLSVSKEVFKTALAANANENIDGYLRRRLASL